MQIERAEVYLDEGAEPIQVLRQAPFILELDTGELGAGNHTLTVILHYPDGSRTEHRHIFELGEGERVPLGRLSFAPREGRLTVDLTELADEGETAPGTERLVAGLSVFLLLLVVGGVWGLIALGNTPRTEAPVEGTAPQEAAAPAAETDDLVTADGATLYTENCSGCHGAQGQGVSGLGPPMAGNDALADEAHVVQALLEGRPRMPGFARLSDEEIAGIASYIRTSWGNRLGTVSPETVARTR